MADLSRRIIPWFRAVAAREPMEVELSPEARADRIASKGLYFARLDRPSVPRGRRAPRKELSAGSLITAAFYGPSDDRATKLVLSFNDPKRRGPAVMERGWADDVLGDAQILEKARSFVQAHPAAAISATGGIIGCPHEEGKEYPEGADCPQCPFWKGKQ